VSKIITFVLALCGTGVALGAMEVTDTSKVMDCSSMSTEMQQFASSLTPANQAMFCGEFTDGQRASAMQMASTQDATGAAMSPDEAVQKVAGANGSNPQGKVPTGCPVK
jgi:hypothetical protein